jgi:hypothetical protein
VGANDPALVRSFKRNRRVLGILLAGTWPLMGCGVTRAPMGGNMPGQSGPKGTPQPMSHPWPNHP